MRRSAFLVLAAFVIVLSGWIFFPTVTGSGTPATASYGLTGFSSIQASNAFKVRVVPDTQYSVSVTCDDNLVSYLLVDTTPAGTLRIGLQPGNSYAFVTVSAEVHMPALTLLDASGASAFTLGAGFVSARPLGISLSGASTAQVAGIVCGALSIGVSGASTLTFAGSPMSESVMASGASSVDLMNSTASSADVTLSGASEAWVNVGAGTVSLYASGASTLYYAGTPLFSPYELSDTSRTVRVR